MWKKPFAEVMMKPHNNYKKKELKQGQNKKMEFLKVHPYYMINKLIIFIGQPYLMLGILI